MATPTRAGFAAADTCCRRKHECARSLDWIRDTRLDLSLDFNSQTRKQGIEKATTSETVKNTHTHTHTHTHTQHTHTTHTHTTGYRGSRCRAFEGIQTPRKNQARSPPPHTHTHTHTSERRKTALAPSLSESLSASHPHTHPHTHTHKTPQHKHIYTSEFNLRYGEAVRLSHMLHLKFD